MGPGCRGRSSGPCRGNLQNVLGSGHNKEQLSLAQQGHQELLGPVKMELAQGPVPPDVARGAEQRQEPPGTLQRWQAGWGTAEPEVPKASAVYHHTASGSA